MHGAISYFEIPTTDPGAAQRFWGGLFGWDFTEGNFPGYLMIAGGGTAGGLAGGDDRPHPRVFFDVENVAAALERVRELGGSAEEPVTLPSGTFARCTDDQGVHFSLWRDA